MANIESNTNPPTPIAESVPRIVDNTVGMLDELLEARRLLFNAAVQLTRSILEGTANVIDQAVSHATQETARERGK